MLAALLTGCTPINQLYEVLFTWSASCPTEKIQFAQADGCLNDGSFEFCVTNGADLLGTLHERVPNMTCVPSAGRARCDAQTQVLCMVSTDGLCRADQPQALTDAGWQLVCSIAAQPYIERIVATWYE
jgi:hypothetical protein